MFAYCNGNPVNYKDPSGNLPTISNAYMCKDGELSAGGGGGIVVPLPDLIDVADEIAAGVAFAVSHVYREFTRSIKNLAYGLTPGSYPVTHHIIPYGSYSTRSMKVQSQLHEAQSIMEQAGVFPETDLHNQVVISAAYHVSLHTDAYIMMVTAPIIALGNNPTQDQVYTVLFDLRLIIAANDPYANGY